MQTLPLTRSITQISMRFLESSERHQPTIFEPPTGSAPAKPIPMQEANLESSKLCRPHGRCLATLNVAADMTAQEFRRLMDASPNPCPSYLTSLSLPRFGDLSLLALRLDSCSFPNITTNSPTLLSGSNPHPERTTPSDRSSMSQSVVLMPEFSGAESNVTLNGSQTT